MRKLFLLIIIVFSGEIYAQESDLMDINISLNLNVPDFDPTFREQYDGLPSISLRLRNIQQEKFTYGVQIDLFKVRAILASSSPLNVEEANFYAGHFLVTYRMVRKGRYELEPMLGLGYTYIRYDGGPETGGGFGISPGILFQYQIEENYNLSLSVNYSTVFNKFGTLPPSGNINKMRLILFRLGFTFDVKKKSISSD